MTYSQNDQQTFRHYLLGKLGGEDLKSFEEQLITDKEDFEELLAAAEDDLADEYVGGQLSNEDRLAFEKHYLITPERHGDVDFARTLDRYFQKQRTFTPPVAEDETERTVTPTPINLTWILGIALVLAVFAVIAVPFYQSFRRAEVATITLNPSIVTRGDRAEENRVSLGDAGTLRVLLNLPAHAPSGAKYRAELEDLEDNTVASQAAKVTNQGAQTVAIDLPTDELRKGRYAVKLFATSSGAADLQLATYNFTVE